MVRFNDKAQISSLANNDIMPITDMSDSTDDRKVTVQQLSQFTVDNIPSLSGGKTLTDNNFTNALKNNYDTAYLNQDLTKYDDAVTYPKDYWVTGVVDGKKVVKKSLVDDNLNNPLTDSTKWANVNFTDLDLINQSKALETGSISSNPDVYADIQKYAHSTFDKSKFEIVGSPTITDDGIASGFSSNNQIRPVSPYNTSSILNVTKSWEIEITVQYLTSDSQFRGIILHTVYPWLGTVGLTGLSFGLVGKPTGEAEQFILIKNISSLGVVDGDFVNIRVKYEADTNKYSLYGSKNNEPLKFISSVVKSGNLSIVESDQRFNFSCRDGNGVPLPFSGSIDLKRFSITVDGVEVFSGNKTGIDTIKPDNYEVVGTPTITADGIASGFSSSNYIKCSGFSFSKTLSFKGVKFRTGDVSGSTRRDIIDTICINFNMFILRVEDGELRLVSMSSGTKSIVSVKNNTNYIVDLDFDLEQGECVATIAENNVKIEKTLTFSLSNKNISYFTIGQRRVNSGENPFNGSIDLNFAVFADGNLVYQPCLKIPYTLSKTGSKIVPAYARNRVKDLYEQTGEALYYTIDEENKNVTLPMADIYGMIQQRGINNKITNCILEAPNGVATYSGNTITVKKGLKVLIPNGRNADGTLNNVEYVFDSDKLFEQPADTQETLRYIAIDIKENKLIAIQASNYYEQVDKPIYTGTLAWIWYNPLTNIIEYRGENQGAPDWTEAKIAIIGKFLNRNAIVSVIPYQPFRAVDYSDTEFIAHQAMPSGKYIDLSLQASGATYTAPADGYFSISKRVVNYGEYLILVDGGTAIGYHAQMAVRAYNTLMIPVKKGRQVRIDYTGNGELSFFRFVYAQGAR